VNVNRVSQNSVASTNVAISGNLDASAPILAGGAAGIPATSAAAGVAAASGTTYTDLNNAAEFSTVVDVFDTLGAKHTVTYFFYHTNTNEYTAVGYINSEDVVTTGTAVPGEPLNIGSVTMAFDANGLRTAVPAPPASDIAASIPWNNGSTPPAAGLDFTFDPMTQFSSSSNILSITQDGQGIGAVTSINIEKNGDIFAILDNGQASVIGAVGMVNFANPEGLQRIGGNLLQQSTSSGEPIVGRAESGTFGGIQSGSLELSSVDIATEFVKLITLQRGFQASSRIITTIDGLLNEIIQLA
jgi:flagellar hook protein FlgE